MGAVTQIRMEEEDQNSPQGDEEGQTEPTADVSNAEGGPIEVEDGDGSEVASEYENQESSISIQTMNPSKSPTRPSCKSSSCTRRTSACW